MSMSNFSPDYSGFVQFATRSHCVLCLVHISTSLSRVEFSFISSINTFSFKKSFVLPLVLETPLRASKNGFGPQPSDIFVILGVLFPAGLHRLQDGRRSCKFLILTQSSLSVLSFLIMLVVLHLENLCLSQSCENSFYFVFF